MNRPVEQIVDADKLDRQTAEKIEKLGAQKHGMEFTMREDKIVIACRKRHIPYYTICKEFIPHHSAASIKFRYLNYLK